MNCRNTQQLNITCGTDVVLHDKLMFDDEVFDPNVSVDIECNLVNSLGKRTSLEYEIADEELVIQVPWVDGRNAGCYGLEVKGKCNGKTWATYADSLIRYTRATVEGAAVVETESDWYDVTQVVSYRYSDSPLDEVDATIDDNYGEPTVTPTYEHNKLTLDFKNLRGNGIASVEQTTVSTEDEGVNETTVTQDSGTSTVIQVRNGSKGSKGDKGDPGDSAIFDPSTGNISTMKQSTGDDEFSPMSQKAVTDIVVQGMYIGNIERNVKLTIVSGQHSTAYNGGITVVTASTTRATADIWYPIAAIREYSHVIVPSGYKLAIYCANTTSKTQSTSAYITSGWLDSQTPDIASHVNDSYPYVCLNYKKDDGSDFTSAEIAALDAGSYLVKINGKNIKDFNGNIIDGCITTTKVSKQAESFHPEIQLDYSFGAGYGGIRPLHPSITNTRACIMQVYPYDFFLEYNKITVPSGYDYSVCSVKNYAESGDTTVNTELEYLIDGWNTGDGQAHDIGKSIVDVFPYVGINFKRHDNAAMTSSDETALNAGVTLSKSATNKGFKHLRIEDRNNQLLGGMDNSEGDGEITLIDKDSIIPLVGAIGTNHYNGGRINLKQNLYSFDRRLFKSLPSATIAQSFAIYGDYLLRFMYSGSTLTAKLYNVTTNTYIRDITLGYGTLTIPHCNTAVFGRIFAQGNSDLPLLYLSQWNGERGCLVYDIHLDGTANLVQSIVPDVSADKFGAGQADWVVDYDQGFIYSIAYKVANGYDVTEANGNRQMVCKYKLPKLSDGESITLQDADIVDCYDVPPMYVMQDKCYRNGRIMVCAGGGSAVEFDTSWNRLYSLNLGERRVEAVVSLYSYLAKEPEGIDMYGDLLLMDYNDNSQYGYGTLYAYEF